MIQEKLMKIQAELHAPKNQRNSFGNYNFRSCEDILEAVKPLLSKYKTTLIMFDTVSQVGDRYYVTATAKITDVEDPADYELVTASAREADAKKGMDDSQITGSASSYARKYALSGLFAIDDNKDADTDERHTETKKRAEKAVEEETPKTEAPKTENIEEMQFRCSDCNTILKPYGKYGVRQIADRTKTNYGRVLCPGCAELEKFKRGK